MAAMGRCTSCGFEPPYPTTACPQCGGVVSARSAAAAPPAEPGEPSAGAAAWGATPPEPGGADRTMRRTDLPQRPLAPPVAAAPVGAPPPPTGAPVAGPPPPAVPAEGAGGMPGGPPTLGRRLSALILDYAVVLGPVLLTAVVQAARGRALPIWLSALLLLWMLASTFALVVVPLGLGGASFGKRVLGVRVVDLSTARPIGIPMAFLRQLVWGALAIPCYLGYLSYVLDKSGRNRGWHEQATNSVTVAVPAMGIVPALRTLFQP